MTEPQGLPEEGAQIVIRQEDLGGVWANFAAVKHSPYEFTIDFARLDFGSEPLNGVVVARVNLSPLFVSQLLDALRENWDSYVAKSMPREVRDGGQGTDASG